MTYVLGADPGKNGAVALINTNADLAAIKDSDLIVIPTKVKNGKIDMAYLNNTLATYKDGIVLSVQEAVHAIFGSSAKSTFEFGDANGVLRTVLELNTPDNQVQLVPPKTWQHVAWANFEVVADVVLDPITKKPKLLKSGKPKVKIDAKATSALVAHSLFPETSFVMPRCKNEHDGCIDAALIAYYALVKFQRTKSLKG